MIGQSQASTHIRLYYLLLLAILYSASKERVEAIDANTCVDSLTERHKPDADVIIGFIGNLRGSSSGGDICDLNEVRNDQIYEAAKILVDHPPNSVRLPNVTIGLELYDDCGVPSLVTQAALRYAAAESECGTGQLRPGVIGPTLDTAVAAAAPVLGAAQIPIVSPTAASISSPDEAAPAPANILRTLPSTSYQARTIVDLIEYFGWNYVSIVATRGQYGEGGANETIRLTREKGICTSETILLDESETEGFVYDDIVTTLLSNFEAKGVVLWCSSANNVGLLAAIERAQGDAYDLVLLSSDSAISDVMGLESYPNAARGMIGLRPFDSSNTAAFTYFHQYSNETFDNIYTIPVVDAILAFEHALASIHREKCAGLPGICPDMAALSGQEMLAALEKTTFPGITGEDISFDSKGEPVTFTLEIVQYQNETSTGASVYSFQQIGVWKPEGGLILMGAFQHYTQNGLVDSQPSSTCGNHCAMCAPSNSSVTPPIDETTPTQGSGNTPKNRGNYYIRIPGDLDIPSILSLSEPGYFGRDGLLCGYVREKEVLSAEALLYALDKVNADPEVFPGVNLGITIMDSCRQSVIATRQLTGVLGQTANLESSGPALGILGPDTDEVTKKVVEEITGPAGLITISHGNSPSTLGSANFLQTTPSLDNQVKAIAQLLAKMDWYYTGIVYSSSTYGTTGYNAFRVAARELGICLGPAKEIPKNAMQPDFDVILTEMHNTKGLNILVTFVEESDARRLLVTEHLYAFHRFSWVGTETWTSDPDLFQGFEKEAFGTLVVVPTTSDLSDFQEYLADVPLRTARARNPWLAPALNRIFPCGNMTEQAQSGKNQNCVELGPSGLGSLITLGEYSAGITHLINALYALAYGADQLRQVKCTNGSQGLCDEFLEVVGSQDFYEAVANVTFQTNEQQFTFVNGSGPPDFTVQNFQQLGSDIHSQEVGTWAEGNLSLNLTRINLVNSAAEGPQREPLKCDLCFDDTENHEPPEILDWELEGIWVTIILAVSAVCLFLIVCTFCTFVFNHNHHVVTSASLSLSLWLLLGLAMMYCMNLAYLLHANTTICAIRRVGTALAYAMTYSALSVKSIRVNRLVRAKPKDSMSFTGPLSQTLLFWVFFSTQFFIAAAWLLLQRPNANAIPGAIIRCEGQENLWSCDYTHIELVVSLAYVYALVLFTFFTSIGAAKYPYILNEGKFLFISSLFSVIILVSWICVYVLADQSIAIPALCIGVTADATVVLTAIFLPKCGALGKPVKKPENLDHKPDGENRNSGMINDRDETTDF